MTGEQSSWMLAAASDHQHLTQHLTGTRRLLHYVGLPSYARLSMQRLSCQQLTARTWSRPWRSTCICRTSRSTSSWKFWLSWRACCRHAPPSTACACVCIKVSAARRLSVPAAAIRHVLRLTVSLAVQQHGHAAAAWDDVARLLTSALDAEPNARLLVQTLAAVRGFCPRTGNEVMPEPCHARATSDKCISRRDAGSKPLLCDMLQATCKPWVAQPSVWQQLLIMHATSWELGSSGKHPIPAARCPIHVSRGSWPLATNPHALHRRAPRMRACAMPWQATSPWSTRPPARGQQPCPGTS